MTIKYNYVCDSCGHAYVEQRGSDEPNPFFTTCNACGVGSYVEASQEVIADTPERSPGPDATTATDAPVDPAI